ncbi:site-specific DNA-methyltransferase [Vibrio sp. Y2-5]|uniref:site-specific DNA-methyltransferase n=1 Tax=Vibrio sp. Y2-5 TaxID=2743977 RepID=UPI0016600E8F|nr:site-specific DNA-methyltransferase [Vibrio sp. Y2-5]MBD0788140.1 site-specific DNA-methyltransferase [Vibrio sp. Y2-5]
MTTYTQMDLFGAVEQAYLESDGKLNQKELYSKVANKLSIKPQEQYGEVGKQKNVNLFYRAVRWVQQSLKAKKLLTNVDKGVWELCGTAKEKLHIINEAKSVVAMSTTLGLMLCSKSESVFDNDIIEEDIDLVLTSPPYILQNPRNYGGTNQSKEWVAFIMNIINKISPRLADGASICLNVGQDSFHKGMPARQTHIERLIIEMEDAGFWLVDRLIWMSNKAPTPYAWTSLNRHMLKASYEFCLHFTNNPLKLQSNNQRVLLPHTESHKAFVVNGGTLKAAVNSDGAHRKSVGDYSNTDLEKGKLASNTLYFANKCKHNEAVNRFAKKHGIPTHGAKMPYRLAEFLVKYLCRAGGLVVDPFGGSGTTAQACEDTGRRWISIEPVLQYIKQSFVRFSSLNDDVWYNPAFVA